MSRTEDKQKEAIAELHEWLENPLSKEDYTIYGVNKIEEKLQEERLPKSTLNGFESLDNWYNNNFIYDMLTKNQSDLRGIAAANGYQILVLADKFAEIYSNNPPSLSFDKVAYWLSNCLLQKWYNESRNLIKIINNGLSTEMLEGGWEIKSASWFILEIANRGFGIDADFSKFNYPNDMGCYQEAIDNWNTHDARQVDSIITKLCEFHLENATYGEEETTPDIQFGDSAWFVYAFEILAWLSVREKIGLENPIEFTHSLMHIELNKLPNTIVPMPSIELFNKVLTKLVS